MIRIRVKPRSRRRGVLGVAGGELTVAVGAAPEDGRATEEALRLLAERLGVPRSSVALTSGVRSRSKRVLIAGETAAAVRAKVAALLERDPS